MLKLLLLLSLLFCLSSCHENWEELAADSTTTTDSSTTSSDASTSPTTAVPCQDDPSTDCTQYKSLCSNDKWAPLLKQFCPVTCNLCPGATTVATTANPRCYDSSSNCANWAKNGYCNNCFYTCAQRTSYCAKTCGFCTPGSCVECKNPILSLVNKH
ncbi:unnamed protein product [Caenorhabditis sp. 36 PRJEB53466]|nr:unnamed protein product [Caenorhabditis sp. 36 PRJEB53466]